MTRGYWKRPDETALVLYADGFLRTGDIGYVDEAGYVFLVDRKKDMILVSGFNVYPNEVEDAAALHPGVREVAAVGVPDERSGEAVKLYVIRKDPNLDAETLIAHCRTQLTGYKVPRYVEFRDDLPRTNVGKILRRELAGSPGAGQGARPGLIPRHGGPATPARFDLARPRRRAPTTARNRRPRAWRVGGPLHRLVAHRGAGAAAQHPFQQAVAQGPAHGVRGAGPQVLELFGIGLQVVQLLRLVQPVHIAPPVRAQRPGAGIARRLAAQQASLAEAVVQLRIHAVAPGLAGRQAMQHFLQFASFQPVRRPGASSARSTVGTRSTLSTMWFSAWPRVASASPDGSMTMKGTRCTVS